MHGLRLVLGCHSVSVRCHGASVTQTRPRVNRHYIGPNGDELKFKFDLPADHDSPYGNRHGRHESTSNRGTNLVLPTSKVVRWGEKEGTEEGPKGNYGPTAMFRPDG
jgi:hypothetical protein